MSASKGKTKEVSLRLLKPTLPDINFDQLFQTTENWKPEYETEGHVSVYDEGIAQYLLCDEKSHYIFYAALILGKPSIRCKLVGEDQEPEDVLEAAGNKFRFSYGRKALGVPERSSVQKIIDYLSKKGYKFDQF